MSPPKPLKNFMLGLFSALLLRLIQRLNLSGRQSAVVTAEVVELDIIITHTEIGSEESTVHIRSPYQIEFTFFIVV